jgi:RNA polymerase sigma-70 factor (ECF subfamily)
MKAPLPNPPAPSELFVAYKTSLRQMLSGMVPPSEVDDLLQSVFLKATNGLAQFKGRSTPEVWLREIARNCALDHLRSRYHHETLRTIPLPTGEDGGTAQHPAIAQAPEVREASSKLETHEMHDCIRQYVRQLPRDYAEIIELRDFAALSIADTATRLGISCDVVKVRLHRAHIALRSILAAQCEFYSTRENILACDRKAVSRCKPEKPDAGA